MRASPIFGIAARDDNLLSDAGHCRKNAIATGRKTSY
jgi:hypothetical protein